MISLIMKKALFVLFFVAVVTFSATAFPAIDNKGTHFLLTFLPNISVSEPNERLIFIECDTDTHVEVLRRNYPVQQLDVKAGVGAWLAFDAAALVRDVDAVTNYSYVEIISEHEITVYGVSSSNFSIGAYLAYPVDTLGTEYIALSYDALHAVHGEETIIYPSQLSIIATNDNTDIEITPSNDSYGHPAGTPYSIRLNRNETYYLTSDVDITGTVIRSSSPVAVLNGVQCANVPIDIYACDHIVEMLPPVTSWGRHFLTVQLLQGNDLDMFRILASEDNTIVRINSDIATTLTLMRGEYYEVTLGGVSQIESSAPVLVAQYTAGEQWDSDPLMTYVVPTEQYLNSYDIFHWTTGGGPVLNGRLLSGNINIIAQTADIYSITLDGNIVDESIFTPIGDSGYSSASLQITKVGYFAPHVEGNGDFAVYVNQYGWWSSLGISGGAGLDVTYPVIDQYPPNVKLVQLNDAVAGVAGDSEDLNLNEILEPEEDVNGNGIIDRRTEDLNGNWRLELGEDLNSNNILDRDTGIYSVSLENGADNLHIHLNNFIPGRTRTEFEITRIDNTLPGSGVLIVVDGAGNTVTRQISIADKQSLHNVRLVSTLSSDRVDLDNSSFSVPPANITTSNGETAIEWQFDTISVDQLENLKYEVVLRDPIPGEQRLVTQKLDLYYIDINGNEVHSGLGETVINVLPSIVQIGVATDKSTYTANEPVAINATYKNLSDYENPLAIRIAVYDSQGAVVANLLETNNVNVAAGGVWSPSNLTFNTGNLYQGLYEVRAELLDSSGKVSTYNSAQFLVVPSSAITVSAKVSTDKYLYDPFEAATLQDHVSNTTTNTILDGMTLSTTVYAPDGSTFWSQSGALPQVLPNSAADLNYPVPLSKAMPGKYRAVLVVKDADGIERALSETAFEVRSSAESGIGLSGEITSLPADGHVLRTEPLHLTANIENLGNAGITNLPLTLAIIDPVSQQIVTQWDEVVGTLAMQSSYSLDRDWPAMAPVGATYIAMLSATIGDEQRVLASKNITIGEKIQSVYSKGTRGRLLVLMDDYSKCKAEQHKEKERKEKEGKDNKTEQHDDDGHCKNEHDNERYKGKDEPSSDAQRAFLESRLFTNGWSYTIVTSADDFAREMRGNGYVAYALLSEDKKLDEQVQQELRERVYRGEGLLVSGTHDERNSHLEPALGIKIEGRYSNITSLTFLDSPLALIGDQALAYRENAMRVVLQGADTAAKYHFRGGKDHHDDQYNSQSDHKDNDREKDREDDRHHNKPSDAAVTVYQFGQGHSVFAGFDLLAQVTAMQNASLLDDFLAAGLNYTHPEPLDAIQTNVIPVTLALTNVGTDVSGRVLVTLPEGVQVVDPGLAVMDTEGRLVWAYDLGTDVSAMLTYWVRILDGMTDLTFSAAIQTGHAPDWQDYGTVNLIVRPGVYPGLYDAINELSSLVSQDWQYRKALKELQHADRSLQRKKVSEAVDHMLKATDALARAKHDRAGGIRVMVDNAIATYAQQMPAHEDHDDRHHR